MCATPRWKEATQLLEEMIAGGSKNTSSSSGGPKILPSIVSYNAAITACARGRRFEMALDLLRDMHAKSGISPDRYSYAAAMTGLAKAGKPTRALLLLQDMRKAGMTPDFVCLSAAMEACENRGSWKEAAEVLAQVSGTDSYRIKKRRGGGGIGNRQSSLSACRKCWRARRRIPERTKAFMSRL